MKHYAQTLTAIFISTLTAAHTAQAQSDDWIIEMLKQSQLTQQEPSNTSQPQGYQPMTREEANQYQTNKQLRVLSEVLQSAGETDHERDQRINALSQQIRDEEAAISRQNNEYSQVQSQRLLESGSTSLDGSASDYSDYADKRAQRLNRTNPARDVPIRGTSQGDAAGSEKRTAGFSQQAMEESYRNSPRIVNGSLSTPMPTGAENSRGRRGSLSQLTAGDVIDVKDVPVPSTPVPLAKYCECRSGDHPDLTGIMCIARKPDGNLDFDNQYLSERFPWTQQCMVGKMADGSPIQ